VHEVRCRSLQAAEPRARDGDVGVLQDDSRRPAHDITGGTGEETDRLLRPFFRQEEGSGVGDKPEWRADGGHRMVQNRRYGHQRGEEFAAGLVTVEGHG
jgi:hypothetical protein